MKLIPLLIFLCNFSKIEGQNVDGIIFNSDKKWEDILIKASASKKPIFIDLYTTWCAPCKQMDKEVFVEKEVGSLFNNNFINVKFDAERGEGVLLNEKHKIDGYPAFLFMTPEGNLVLKHLGSLDKHAFLKIGETALKEFKSPTPILMLDKEYKDGKKNDPAFVYEYIFKKKSLGFDVKDIIENYLNIIPEDSISSKSVEKVITYNNVSLNGNGMELLLNMYFKDPHNIYLTGPYWCLYRNLSDNIERAGSTRDFVLLQQVINIYYRMYEGSELLKKRVTDMAKFKFYVFAKDTSTIKIKAIEYATAYIDNINVDSLKSADEIEFKKVLLSKFSTNEVSELEKRAEYKDFKRLYRSERKSLAFDIIEISNVVCNTCGPKIEDVNLLMMTKSWLEKAKLLFDDKELYDAFTQNIMKCIDQTLQKSVRD
jgi:thiol-disulfide isomerase/thioredoxin